MIGGRTVIGIIPARGGSKGLPGKNTLPMCGKPLIAWTIEKALKSKYLDLVLVSTDSDEIARISRGYGASVPFLRPAELATDESTTYAAIRHALEFLSRKDGRTFDLTVLLEPTSPLREDDDVDRMLEILEARASNFDSIISVGIADSHPSICKRLVGSQLESFCPNLPVNSRRQDNEPAYFPFGVAYIAKTENLFSEGTFYTRRCTYFVLRRYQNYEVDDLYNFLCAERVMRHEWNLP